MNGFKTAFLSLFSPTQPRSIAQMRTRQTRGTTPTGANSSVRLSSSRGRGYSLCDSILRWSFSCQSWFLPPCSLTGPVCTSPLPSINISWNSASVFSHIRRVNWRCLKELHVSFFFSSNCISIYSSWSQLDFLQKRKKHKGINYHVLFSLQQKVTGPSW